MERFNQLDDVLRSCWNLLFRATVQRNSPFRTPVLTTIADAQPNARTVVMRSVDTAERQLLCYTDMRSAKVKELKANSIVCWVFWDESRKIQIRATGKTKLHNQDELAQAKWKDIPVRNRKDYATRAAPGTPQSKSKDYLPEYWNEESLALEKTEDFFENFVVIVCEVTQLDWLHLHREGHQRAKFNWNENTSKWDKTWLVP